MTLHLHSCSLFWLVGIELHLNSILFYSISIQFMRSVSIENRFHQKKKSFFLLFLLPSFILFCVCVCVGRMLSVLRNVRGTFLQPVMARLVSKKLLEEWVSDRKELDLEVVKSIWPERPREVKVSEEEHERRVIIAKNWSRYRRVQSLGVRKELAHMNVAAYRADETLKNADPKVFGTLDQLPDPTLPTEIVPPYHTPPIPGFFHGKREL